MNSREEILALLRENARYSTEDLARQTGLAESEVEATIEDLETEGIIRGYQAVVDLDETEHEHVRATVELNVTLDRETGYDDIAARLAKFPEVQGLRLVSGDFDFQMEVEGDSMSEVSRFISEKVAPVPEITQTVTHYIMESYKERGVEFGDGHEDDRLSVSP
ncbi:Lrp/AsnC family transcriptional regulator [Halobacteriales archaeon QS_4_69_31]|jgi:DNA-binding Lrp family transcriptional regulator|nr:MAG: Lrp/AsnC family transcriptional regulator [Halobacteriales archaeon QS_4_69_31]